MICLWPLGSVFKTKHGAPQTIDPCGTFNKAHILLIRTRDLQIGKGGDARMTLPTHHSLKSMMLYARA